MQQHGARETPCPGLLFSTRERLPGCFFSQAVAMSGQLVTVIILNWNQWPRTLENLDSLARSDYGCLDVLVVDNGSQGDADSTWERYAARAGHGASARLLRLERNLGFSGGVNAAVEHLLPDLPDYVFLLNNDAETESVTVSECVRVAKESGAAVVGCTIRDPSTRQPLFMGGRWPEELFFSRRRASFGAGWWEADWVEGSAMLIRKDLIVSRLSQCGYLLDPTLFMYCEDLELCRWALERGFRVVMAGGAAVYHAVGGSSGGRENALMYYYTTRNRVLLARQLLPPGWRLLFNVWFPLSRMARVLQRLLQGRAEVARSILLGLWDGYRGVSGKCAFHPDGVAV